MSYNILSFEEKRMYIKYLEIIFSIYLNISVFEFRILLLRTTKYFDESPSLIVYVSTLNEIYGNENIRIIDIIDKITDVFFADNIENKNLFYLNIDNLFSINLDNINFDEDNINIKYIKDNIRENININIQNQLVNLFFVGKPSFPLPPHPRRET
jgi:hypothetical protein